MAYQSLYRRYRSAKFGELVGQQHVVTALRNAITDDRVGHAYLFSGPRGTGKTSTARILGKALNCTDLGDDGEPCCVCESCVSFESGTSYDLHELDAASNNGVEAIRDLISKVALGSPGRTKVYILDEVHMLTAGAENALLKTLEEPPDHVVFVLATTEPHKVVPTIRSRTQHYEFELIAASELESHVRFIVDDAGLKVDDAMIEYVLRVGGGSARDTLSALDQVVAAGGIPRDDDVILGVLDALAQSDSAAVIAAVNQALKAGRDPRVIGEALLERLRDGFLAAMGASLDHLSEGQVQTASNVAEQMGPAAVTRALESIGGALVAMRQAPDPRVDLEVALLRLTRPDLDTGVEALVARIERLEKGIVAGETGTRPADGARAALTDEPVRAAQSAASPTDTATESTLAEPRPTRRRATLGARRGSAKPAPTNEPGPSGVDEPPAAPVESPANVAGAPQEPSGGVLTLDQVEASWADVRAALPGRARSRFSGGRFISVDGNAVVFGLPNAIHRDRCQEYVADLAEALAKRFGFSTEVTLIIDGDAQPPTPRAAEPAPGKPSGSSPASEPEEETIDVDQLTDAETDAVGGVGLLTDAFPGAQLLDPDTES